MVLRAIKKCGVIKKIWHSIDSLIINNYNVTNAHMKGHMKFKK